MDRRVRAVLPDIGADVIGRRPAHMRHLAPQRPPYRVQAPRQSRGPGKTSFDQHDLQRGNTLEHAFENHAGKKRLLRLRVPDHLLEIMRAPPTAGDGPAAITEGVHPDRQAGCGRRLIDRPVAPRAERFGRAAQQQHLGEIRVAGAAFDLPHRRRRIFIRHHHRPAQPPVARGPSAICQSLVAWVRAADSSGFWAP